jgi:vanillate O-demethylase ferredoxin subunit
MMAAAAEAATDWPAGTVHCEYFNVVASPVWDEDRRFRVRLAKSGVEFEVPVGETIVGVLRRVGIDVGTSCELGYCGACLTPYLSGEPDHRDQVLGENDRRRYVLICCSRAKTPVLELDL